MTRPIRIYALLLVAAACLAACGPNASLKRHAFAAQVLEEVSVTAKATVLDLYRAELEAAVVGVDDPARRTELVTAARAHFEARPFIPAVNALIVAKDAYVRAVLLAAQEDGPSWAELRPVLARALLAYEALRKALGSAGDRLPAVPSVIAGMVS